MEQRRHFEEMETLGLAQQFGTEKNEHVKTPTVSVPLPNSDPNIYTVYGENYCQYTKNACLFLVSHGQKHDYHTFEGNEAEREKIRQRARGHRTIPMIFRGQQFIGGFNELKRAFGAI